MNIKTLIEKMKEETRELVLNQPSSSLIIDEHISSFLSSLIDEEVKMLEGKGVPVIHAEDCEYQRKGCDCGFMERTAYNKGISDSITTLQEIKAMLK